MAENSANKVSWIKKAMTMMSVVMSSIMTFLLTPQVYNGTAQWVRDYAVANYGTWTESIAAFIWFLTSAVLLFAFFNLLAAVMIWMGMTYLMSRGWIE